MACIDYVFTKSTVRYVTTVRRTGRKKSPQRALLQRGDHNLFGLGIGRLRVATGPSP